MSKKFNRVKIFGLDNYITNKAVMLKLARIREAKIKLNLRLKGK